MQSGSMENPSSDSINEGDWIRIENEFFNNDITTYVEGEKSGYRKFGSYGDVIVYSPNGDKSRTRIPHRAVIWIEFNKTTYDYETMEGGSYDVPSMELYNSTCKITLENFEWQHQNKLVIDLSIILESFNRVNKEPHSGYITKGDDNSGVDQTSMFLSKEWGWMEPVKEEWIIGKVLYKLPYDPVCCFFPSILIISIIIIGIIFLWMISREKGENKKIKNKINRNIKEQTHEHEISKKKSPFLAALLNMFFYMFGLGYFYIGQRYKGIGIIISLIIEIFLFSLMAIFIPILGIILVIPFLFCILCGWIYSIIDVYLQASIIKCGGSISQKTNLNKYLGEYPPQKSIFTFIPQNWFRFNKFPIIKSLFLAIFLIVLDLITVFLIRDSGVDIDRYIIAIVPIVIIVNIIILMMILFIVSNYKDFNHYYYSVVIKGKDRGGDDFLSDLIKNDERENWDFGHKGKYLHGHSKMERISYKKYNILITKESIYSKVFKIYIGPIKDRNDVLFLEDINNRLKFRIKEPRRLY